MMNLEDPYEILKVNRIATCLSSVAIFNYFEQVKGLYPLHLGIRKLSYDGNSATKTAFEHKQISRWNDALLKQSVSQVT